LGDRFSTCRAFHASRNPAVRRKPASEFVHVHGRCSRVKCRVGQFSCVGEPGIVRSRSVEPARRRGIWVHSSESPLPLPGWLTSSQALSRGWGRAVIGQGGRERSDQSSPWHECQAPARNNGDPRQRGPRNAGRRGSRCDRPLRRRAHQWSVPARGVSRVKSEASGRPVPCRRFTCIVAGQSHENPFDLCSVNAQVQARERMPARGIEGPEPGMRKPRPCVETRRCGRSRSQRIARRLIRRNHLRSHVEPGFNGGGAG